jgi:hypothetical protein
LRCYIVGGIDLATIVSSSLGLLRGKPQIWAFLDQTMAALSVLFSLLGASFLEQMLDREGIRWSGGSSVASIMAGLGGMDPQGLGDERGLMISAQVGGTVWRRGCVDGRSVKFDAWIPVLKMSSWEMEAATSESVRWHLLRVCWTVWCSWFAVGRLGEAFGITMLCIGVWSGHLLDLSMVTPFHQSCRFSVCC